MFPIAVIGSQEAIIIVGAIVLVFGVSRLPQIGRSLAEGIHEFKKASKEIRDEGNKPEEKKVEGE